MKKNKTENLTIEQKKNLKKLHITWIAMGILLVAMILFAMYGFAAYLYPVDNNGQFLNQPSLTFINFSENFGPIGQEVTNGGLEGQTVGIYISPFVQNSNIRLMLAFFSVISFLGFLLSCFMSFFYYMNSRNVPNKTKDKYKDSIDYKKEQKKVKMHAKK
ncbi:hypothetical protein [Mycoplasmoides pirum]|uniref:hypothetical protein n=1 Tax=Mycoplasmoides pirum TaxID=2122 RepID=UPI0004854BD4|nr:hypothetical protein [Mycoplasmoides pirum]